MMFLIKLIQSILLIGLSSSFMVNKNVRSSRLVVMKDIQEYPGIISSLGFFDPLKLSFDQEEIITKRWRESELKHGRIAMLAFTGMLIQESFHSLLLFPTVVGPAITHIDQIQLIMPNFLWLLISVIGKVLRTFSIHTLVTNYT